MEVNQTERFNWLGQTGLPFIKNVIFPFLVYDDIKKNKI